MTGNCMWRCYAKLQQKSISMRQATIISTNGRKNNLCSIKINIGYKHFYQFLIFNRTFAFSTPYYSCNCCMYDPTSNADVFIMLE